MPAPRFFALAYRIAVYGGVMQQEVVRRQSAKHQAPAAGREMSLSQWSASHPDAMARAEREWKKKKG